MGTPWRDPLARACLLSKTPRKPGLRENQGPVENHESHPGAGLLRPLDRDASPDMKGLFGGISRDSVVLRSGSVRPAGERRFLVPCVPNHDLGSWLDCEPSEVVIE